MATSDTTCWTMIDAAAAGSEADRDEFAKFYLPAVEAYLHSRWRNSAFRQSHDDAVQEVFVECFRDQGPLARADRNRAGGFRPFLYGVVRNIALRFETRQATDRNRANNSVNLEGIAGDETQLSLQFDRAWARAIMQRAAKVQAERARELGDDAVRRVDLLRLRFQEGLPIRDIAAKWGEDPVKIHHEYARARKEFKAVLVEIVAFHHPGADDAVQRECEMLLEILG